LLPSTIPLALGHIKNSDFVLFNFWPLGKYLPRYILLNFFLNLKNQNLAK